MEQTGVFDIIWFGGNIIQNKICSIGTDRGSWEQICSQIFFCSLEQMWNRLDLIQNLFQNGVLLLEQIWAKYAYVPKSVPHVKTWSYNRATIVGAPSANAANYELSKRHRRE